MLIFGGSENEIKGDVIAFDIQEKLFKRLTPKRKLNDDFAELDEHQPKPREFHQAVFDT